MDVSIDIIKGDEFFITTIKEFPAVLSQGKSVEEAKENILEALQLFLEDESD
jgi:predicted RNase H-like HicB family nuclease